MQRLFPPPLSEPSEASNAGSASPSPPSAPASAPDSTPAAENPEPEAAAPVRPFSWPPPEEDLDDWHVFQFAEGQTSAPKPSDAPTLKLVASSGEPVPPPATEGGLAHLDLSEASLLDTAELGTKSPFAKIDPASAQLAPTGPVVLPFTTPETAPIAAAPTFATPETAPLNGAPAFGTPDTSPLTAAPTFGTPATAPLGTPAPVPDFSDSDATVTQVPPLSFRTPDTAPLGTPVPPVAESKPSAAAASLALSGALAETGTALPARRPATPPSDLPLMSATVEVITRSAQAKQQQARVAAPATTNWVWIRWAIVIALALLAIGEAAYIATLRLRTPADVAATGALFVQSQPAGADIAIDGKVVGKTPFRLDLPPGQHTLELRKDNVTRRFPLVVAAGTQMSQYVEMRTGESETETGSGSRPAPAPAPAPPARQPAADPAAAAAAAAATEPPPPAPRPVPTTGWLLVQSNIQLSILRNGESIGNSDDGKLTLGAGNQELELSNTAAGYREATTIRILPGQITTLRPELPQSTLDIESSPNAKVIIDGHEVGETPLAPIALTIGPHDILFKHPDFPDRRVSTFIKVATPAHVSIDLSVP